MADSQPGILPAEMSRTENNSDYLGLKIIIKADAVIDQKYFCLAAIVVCSKNSLFCCSRKA